MTERGWMALALVQIAWTIAIFYIGEACGRSNARC